MKNLSFDNEISSNESFYGSSHGSEEISFPDFNPIKEDKGLNEEQKKLVEDNLYLVSKLLNASKYKDADFSYIDKQDIKSAGVEALIKSALIYKPGLATFKTYASLKIKYAFKDECRKADNVSREDRRILGKINKHIIDNGDNGYNGYNGDISQLSKDIGISTKKIREVYFSKLRNKQVSIYDTDNNYMPHLYNNYEEWYDNDILSSKIVSSIRSIENTKKQKVINLHLLGKSNKEIGEIFGFSESRTSQIIAECKKQIHDILT